MSGFGVPGPLVGIADVKRLALICGSYVATLINVVNVHGIT